MLSIAAFVVVTSLPNSLAPVPQVDLASLFPTAKAGITITVDSKNPQASTSFEQMLDEFTRVTGVTLQMNKETQNLIKHYPLGLNQTLQVPASEVVRIVEVLMIANDFVFLRVSNEEPRVWIVQSLQAGGSRGGPQVRNDAVLIDEKDLPLCSDHPATLVTTTIELPNTDVRTLSNSMRTMFTDANTQQIIPVGSNSLILTGFAPNVAGLARLLHEIDRVSKADPSLQPASTDVRPAPKAK